MMKIVKKPIVFDAVEFDGTHVTLLKAFPEISLLSNINHGKTRRFIENGDDIVEFYVGDIIIKDINGDYYPVRPDVFAKTYNVIE